MNSRHLTNVLFSDLAVCIIFSGAGSEYLIRCKVRGWHFCRVCNCYSKGIFMVRRNSGHYMSNSNTSLIDIN
jgi:hypothetical protein